jgi:hypoxanthine phosphoribosyltransferase
VKQDAAKIIMDSVKIHDSQFRLLLKPEKIQSVVKKMSKQLNSDLADNDVVFLVNLNGAFLFAADLIRRITFHCRISFVKFASYEGFDNSGRITQLIGLNEMLEEKTVVIVEDIVDSGNTLDSIIKEISSQKPSGIKVASLMLKPEAYEFTHKIDYVGFRISNQFVVGYGLDYNGLGRNLNSIYVKIE